MSAIQRGVRRKWLRHESKSKRGVRRKWLRHESKSVMVLAQARRLRMLLDQEHH
ncbi:MAG: hypothetical protein ACPIOQ_19530 [Promethearchaeia archaeon]